MCPVRKSWLCACARVCVRVRACVLCMPVDIPYSCNSIKSILPTHIFTLSFHAKPSRILVQSQLVLSLFVASPTKSLFRRLSRKQVALFSASRLHGFVDISRHRFGLLTTPFCLLYPSIIPPQHGSICKEHVSNT